MTAQFVPVVMQGPMDIVQDQIEAMADRADRALTIVQAGVGQLIGVNVDLSATPPAFEMPLTADPFITKPDGPRLQAFGDVGPFDAPEFENFDDLLGQLDAVLAGVTDPVGFIPDFESIVVPPPPPPINTGDLPARPQINEPSIPAAPVLTMPVLDDLAQINLPAFVNPVLPTFVDASEVVFDGVAPNTLINWTEPTYQSEILPDLVRELKRMLAGGTGLHPAIEQALFDRARVREDQTALKATQEAVATWAARGFSMPSGMLVEQVNAVQEGNREAANTLQRDILIKSAEWEIENLRVAVTQGIALETLLQTMFENMAKRLFDQQLERLRADISMFQAQVQLFNARQAARQILVEVFKAKLEAALAPLEVYKAQIAGAVATGQINESLVRAFAAKIDALRSIVGIFQARIDAVKVQSDIEKNKVDIYRADIEAYGARISAQAKVFDAYEAQVRGEAAKAGIYEARARAFAATLQAQASNNNVKIAAIGGKTDAIQAAVQKFAALVSAEQAQINAQATEITAKAQGFTADVGRYSAELSSNSQQAALNVQLSESRLRNNLAYYEVRMREYDAALNRLVEAARVDVAKLSAITSVGGQLAAGAMSAMHVQASMSGSGSASTSSSVSRSDIYNHDVED